MNKRTKQIVIWILMILLLATMITPIFMLTQLRLGMSHDLALKKEETWVFSIHPNEIMINDGQISPLNEAIDPSAITWTNSDESIVSLSYDTTSQHFTLTALANGTAVLVGSDGLNPSLRLEVNVLDGIAFETKPQIIDIQQPLALEVITQPLADILHFKPSFRSSNPEIISVSQDGIAIGVAQGKATIFAHFLGYETSVDLEVLDLPDFKYEVDKLEMNMQSTVQIPYQLSIYDQAIDKTVVWSSSNSNIVEVSSDGLISAFNRGSATVTATVNQNTYDLLVQVKSNVVDFTIEEEHLVLNKGDQHTLKISFNPQIYENYPITWVSSKPTIATVVNGVITAIGAGKTMISAQVDAIKRELEVSVEVPLESITVSPNNAKIYEGQGVQLNPLYYPTDTTTAKNPVFSSSNPLVARVNEKGFVVGEAVGSAIIFVSNAGFQYSVNIQVQNKIDEQGNQVVSGVYRDGSIRFDGVNFQMDRDFILEIGTQPQFSNAQTIDVEVILPENFFDEDKALFEKLVLNSGYIGKEVLLTVKKGSTPMFKYHFDNYDLAYDNLWANVSTESSSQAKSSNDFRVMTLPMTLDDTHKLRYYVGEPLANQSLASYRKQEGEWVLVAQDLVVEPTGYVMIKNFEKDEEIALEVPRLQEPMYTQWYFIVGAALLVIFGLTYLIVGSKLRKTPRKDEGIK